MDLTLKVAPADDESVEPKTPRSYFRGKPRPGRRIAVRYRVLDDAVETAEEDGYTKNIGVGGAFILTSDPPPSGTRLLIALEVPAADKAAARTRVELAGEIRWIVDGKHDEPEREHGMGVRFSRLDIDQLLALNAYFASLTSTVEHDEA